MLPHSLISNTPKLFQNTLLTSTSHISFFDAPLVTLFAHTMTAEEVGYDRNPDSFVMNWETVSPYDIGSMVK